MEREIEKWEQSRALEIKLLMGLEFKSGFVSIIHFPIPCFRLLGPVDKEEGEPR